MDRFWKEGGKNIRSNVCPLECHGRDTGERHVERSDTLKKKTRVEFAKHLIAEKWFVVWPSWSLEFMCGMEEDEAGKEI